MKRKRFIKLLMARGVDRNMATAATALVGGEYGKDYATLYRVAKLIEKASGLPFVYAVYVMGCPLSSPYWKMINWRWLCRAKIWRTNSRLIREYAHGLGAFARNAAKVTEFGGAFCKLSQAATGASAALMGFDTSAHKDQTALHHITPLCVEHHQNRRDDALDALTYAYSGKPLAAMTEAEHRAAHTYIAIGRKNGKSTRVLEHFDELTEYLAEKRRAEL